MYKVLLGIGFGIFIDHFGKLFLVFVKKTLKERKENEMRIAKDNLKTMVKEVLKEKNE